MQYKRNTEMKTLSIPDINAKPMSKFYLKLWVICVHVDK